MVNYDKPKLPFFDNLVGNKEAGIQLFILTFILFSLYLFLSDFKKITDGNVASGTVLKIYPNKKNSFSKTTELQYIINEQLYTSFTSSTNFTFDKGDSILIIYDKTDPFKIIIWSFPEKIARILIYYGAFIFAYLITIYKTCFN